MKLDFPADPYAGQKFTAAGVTWTFDGFKWTAVGNTMGIPDAPLDGKNYARGSAAWNPITHEDITDWDEAIGETAPQSSDDAPIMDGVAAPGTATTWARADHIHPSDTSRLALEGGIMVGALTLAGNPVDPLDAATKQYVDVSASFTHDNRIINGDMRIDQRNNGASGTAAGYTVDRWKYGATQTAKITWRKILMR